MTLGESSRKKDRYRTVGVALLSIAMALACSWEGKREPEGSESSPLEGDEGKRMDTTSSSGEPTTYQDVAYGPHPQNKLDVYLPDRRKDAPIFFMVHGGAWFLGDKAMPAVVENKRRHWVRKGYALVSVNYRMDEPVDPIVQAEDVALALAFVQGRAKEWGADPNRVVVIGHSAGAHLVSLLAADPTLRKKKGAAPWRGTVALDSAAFDVQRIMQRRHFRFYDRVFGASPDYWRAASPYHRLTGLEAAFLAVCSSERRESCAQARDFMQKAQRLGGSVRVIEVAKSHKELNEELGRPGEYTSEVEAFLRTIDLP